MRLSKDTTCQDSPAPPLLELTPILNGFFPFSSFSFKVLHFGRYHTCPVNPKLGKKPVLKGGVDKEVGARAGLFCMLIPAYSSCTCKHSSKQTISNTGKGNYIHKGTSVLGWVPGASRSGRQRLNRDSSSEYTLSRTGEMPD